MLAQISATLCLALCISFFITFVKNPIHYNGKDETTHQFVG